MCLVDDFIAVFVGQVKFHPAELCARTTVGTPPKTVFRCIANAGIAYAKCAMNEYFQFCLWHSPVYVSYFFK